MSRPHRKWQQRECQKQPCRLRAKPDRPQPQPRHPPDEIWKIDEASRPRSRPAAELPPTSILPGAPNGFTHVLVMIFGRITPQSERTKDQSNAERETKAVVRSTTSKRLSANCSLVEMFYEIGATSAEPTEAAQPCRRHGAERAKEGALQRAEVGKHSRIRPPFTARQIWREVDTIDFGCSAGLATPRILRSTLLPLTGRIHLR